MNSKQFILRKAGFICLKNRGKGSHTVWEDPNVKNNVILSGKDGKDAQYYQEKRVEQTVKEPRKNEQS